MGPWPCASPLLLLALSLLPGLAQAQGREREACPQNDAAVPVRAGIARNPSGQWTVVPPGGRHCAQDRRPVARC